MDTRYILAVDSTGSKYIALDKPSGGYPYEVASIWDAEVFETRKAAAEYTAVFAHSGGGTVGNWPWIPVKVNLVTTETDVFNKVELGKVFDENTAIGKFTRMLADTGIHYDIQEQEDSVIISYDYDNTDQDFIFNAHSGELVAVQHG